jgi:hypothetical protein
LDPRKKAGWFSSGSSRLSTIAAALSLVPITPDVSVLWQVGSPAYEETNPQDITNVVAMEWTYPHQEPCEEKAGLSLIGRLGRYSLR